MSTGRKTQDSPSAQHDVLYIKLLTKLKNIILIDACLLKEFSYTQIIPRETQNKVDEMK